MQVTELTEDDGAHLVLLEVEGEAVGVMRKLEQLTCHRVLEAVDLRDSVAGGHNAADISRDQARVEVLEPLLDDL